MLTGQFRTTELTYKYNHQKENKKISQKGQLGKNNTRKINNGLGLNKKEKSEFLVVSDQIKKSQSLSP